MLPHRVEAGTLGSGCQPLLGAEDADPEAGSPPQGPTEEGSTSRLAVLEGITLFGASLNTVSAVRTQGDLPGLTAGRAHLSQPLEAPCPSLHAGAILHVQAEQALPSRRAGAGRGQGGVPGDEEILTRPPASEG